MCLGVGGKNLQLKLQGSELASEVLNILIPTCDWQDRKVQGINDRSELKGWDMKRKKKLTQNF